MVKLRYDTEEGNCTFIKTEDELEGIVTTRLAEQYASLFGVSQDEIQVEIECGSIHLYVYSENSTTHAHIVNQSTNANATQRLCHPVCVGCDEEEVCFDFVRVDQSTAPPPPPSKTNSNIVTIVVATVVPSVVVIAGILSYVIYRSRHSHRVDAKKRQKKKHKRKNKARPREMEPLL